MRPETLETEPHTHTTSPWKHQVSDSSILIRHSLICSKKSGGFIHIYVAIVGGGGGGGVRGERG